MTAENISTTISAKNAKTRIWVFLAAFLFSVGLYLVFKPRSGEISVSALFLQAIIYGLVFGFIFQYAVRHLNGVNLRPKLLEKTFSKLSESRKDEKLALKIPAAKTGFFPKAGVLAISDSNIYFVPHRSTKVLAFQKEHIVDVEFKLADFNADGKEKNVIFQTREKDEKFLIFTHDEQKVKTALSAKTQ